MIIDAHHHLLEKNWYPRELLLRFVTFLTPYLGESISLEDKKHPDQLIDKVFKNVFDETGDHLVKIMKEAGVDKTCIFAMDTELTCGVTEVSIDEQNEKIAAAAKKYPDQLIPFYAIDPRQKNAATRFKNALLNLGMKGIKLHPALGNFLPDEKCCYPIYKTCMKYGVPVLFHSGHLVKIEESNPAHPRHVEQVLIDFPKLPIILAHFSLSSWETALQLAQKYPNLYFDFSLLQLTYLKDPADCYKQLRKFLDITGPERIFWGTDSPYYNDIFPTKRWVDIVSHPNLSSCPEISFSREEIDLIMGDAFAKLIKIK